MRPHRPSSPSAVPPALAVPAPATEDGDGDAEPWLVRGYQEPGGCERVGCLLSVEVAPSPSPSPSPSAWPWARPHRRPPPDALYSHPLRRRRLLAASAPVPLLWKHLPSSAPPPSSGPSSSASASATSPVSAETPSGLELYLAALARLPGAPGSSRAPPPSGPVAGEYVAERPATPLALLEALAARLQGSRPHPHPNLCPTLAVRALAAGGAEAWEEAQDFTLRDLLWFAPHALPPDTLLFALYQLLAALLDAHRLGVPHGALALEHVGLQLWPAAALPAAGGGGGGGGAALRSEPAARGSAAWVRLAALGLGRFAGPAQRLTALTWRRMCGLWQARAVSNLQYLLWVNEAAGRRAGDPNFHPIVPWVSDLATREGALRDLSRTKFRLTKGDEQLDHTYAALAAPPAPSDDPRPRPPAHHVPDAPLSQLSYYNYTARRTPVALLQRFVRAHYQPHEYPASVARLYAWSPDECIPELYTDPALFRSQHPDMPDLQVPDWARSVDDFLAAHRALLESEPVSAALHRWLDLTFGHLQRGPAAVAAKNVVLLEGTEPRNHGFVLLFPSPHPPRGPRPSSSSSPSADASPPGPALQLGGRPPSPDEEAGAGAAGRRGRQGGGQRAKPLAKFLAGPLFHSLLEPLKLRRPPSAPGSPAPPAPTPAPAPAPAPAPPGSPPLDALGSAGDLPSLADLTVMPSGPSARFVERLTQLEAEAAGRTPAADDGQGHGQAEGQAEQDAAPESLGAAAAQDAEAAAALVERLYGTAPFAGPLQEGAAELPGAVARLVRVLRRQGLVAALAEPLFPPAFAAAYDLLCGYMALPLWPDRLALALDRLAQTPPTAALPGPLLLPFLQPLFQRLPVPSVPLFHALARCAWTPEAPYWQSLAPVLRHWCAAHDDPALQAEVLGPRFLEEAWRARLPAAPEPLCALLAEHVRAVARARGPVAQAAAAALRWVQPRLGAVLADRLVVAPLAACLRRPPCSAAVSEALVHAGRELGEAMVVGHLLPRLFAVLQELSSRASKGDDLLVTCLLLLLRLLDFLSSAAAARMIAPARTGHASVLVCLLLNPPPHPPALQALAAVLVHIAARLTPAAAAQHLLPYVAQFLAPFAELYDAGARWRGRGGPDMARIYSREVALLLYAPLAALVPALVPLVPAAPLLDELARQAALAPPPPLLSLLGPAPAHVPGSSPAAAAPAPVTTATASAARPAGLRQSVAAPLASAPLAVSSSPALDLDSPWSSGTGSGSGSPAVAAAPDEGPDEGPDGGATAPWCATARWAWEGEEEQRPYADPLDGRVVHSVRAHLAPVRALLVHNDLERAVLSLGARDPVLRLWGTAEGRLLRAFSGHRGAPLGADWLDREGGQLASCDAAEAVLWDVETGKPILRTASAEPAADLLAIAALNAPQLGVVGAGGNSVFACATADASILLCDVRSGDQSELRVPAAGASVRCLCVGPEHDWLAVGLSSGGAVALDLRTGFVLHTWRAADAPLVRMTARARGPAGLLLSAAPERAGSGVQAWSLRAGPVLERTLRPASAEPVLAWAPYGPHGLLASSGGRLGYGSLLAEADGTLAMKRLLPAPVSLTALAALPLHRLCVAGTDTGHLKFVV